MHGLYGQYGDYEHGHDNHEHEEHNHNDQQNNYNGAMADHQLEVTIEEPTITGLAEAGDETAGEHDIDSASILVIIEDDLIDEAAMTEGQDELTLESATIVVVTHGVDDGDSLDEADDVDHDETDTETETDTDEAVNDDEATETDDGVCCGSADDHDEPADTDDEYDVDDEINECDETDDDRADDTDEDDSFDVTIEQATVFVVFDDHSAMDGIAETETDAETDTETETDADTDTDTDTDADTDTEIGTDCPGPDDAGTDDRDDPIDADDESATGAFDVTVEQATIIVIIADHDMIGDVIEEPENGVDENGDEAEYVNDDEDEIATNGDCPSPTENETTDDVTAALA
ncbi:von Willebrand factor A [Natrialba chahannaoensis JCM 10990]|uniref:von Willebrand factor A n=1 Tax=Natrialba chahannaoensis JCM 10990 TaxID=1227492 RepID=M0A949_9EURY|nr:hypothetical protein [Natrialba chahannaoensis]ELY95305.1 von Willebrand factor A [Natrialba chahannaoensis JCM 10990]